jgi:predicted nucleotidyltransferase
MVSVEDKTAKDIKEKVDECVKRIREAAGPNVESIILFGSAVSGDF